VGEFLAWSSSRIRSVPRQRPKGDKIGLYRVRPTKIAMPAPNQIWNDKEEGTVMVPSVFGAAYASGCQPPGDPTDDSAGLGGNTPAQTEAQQMVPALAAQKIAAAAPIDPPQMAEFAIYVEVPSLGTTRRLNSGAFHGKLNDLYERGLIARESARAAMRLADDRRRQPR
jgi:hypothetical protein